MGRKSEKMGGKGTPQIIGIITILFQPCISIVLHGSTEFYLQG